jgi:hypothetical protein
MRREIFSDELAGEAGSAIDDDVEFRRRLHIDSLRKLTERFYAVISGYLWISPALRLAYKFERRFARAKGTKPRWHSPHVG